MTFGPWPLLSCLSQLDFETMHASLDRRQFEIGRILDFPLSGLYIISIQPDVSRVAIRGQKDLQIKRFGASGELDLYLVIGGAVLVRAVPGRGRVADRHFSRGNVCGLPSRRKLRPAESGAPVLHTGKPFEQRVDYRASPS